MSDNKNKNGNPDRKRISLSEEYEVRDWSERFNVSANEIRDAINQVGNLATDVSRYLKTGINK